MTDLTLNKTYNGFTLCEIKRVDEIESTIYRFCHNETGAELIFSDRKDENKAFAIAFKTLPFDDTGVFHILEHSVLCGSEKYPVKDPFVRMLQTSMQTFLNAMTYPDKTIYPVSSRNEKDFNNLMDVYLDAVFHPSFLKNPNVFYQEGRHYEVDEDGTPYLQGIVYSEMQGVFSELDGEIESAVSNAVFGGTPYEYVYGGHPDAIPTLTYESFCETYHKFYNPSNSIICLDGSIQLLPTLAYLDDVLCKTDHKEKSEIKIPMKNDISVVTQRRFYGVSENESGNKDALIFTRITKPFDKKKENLAINILCDYLCETNESPLKRALLDTGLCEDVRLYTVDDFIQSVLVLEIRGSKEAHFTELKNAVKNAVNDVLKNGIDKSELEAYLAKIAFYEKNRAANYGLNVISKILQSRVYDGDIAHNLSFNDAIDELLNDIKEAESGIFEEQLADIFNVDTFSEIRFIAKPGLFAENQKKQYEKMCELRDKIKSNGVEALDKTAKELLAWQEANDTNEALDTLPTISLDDIDEQKSIIQPTIEKEDFVLITIPPQNPDITYLKLYFPISKDVEDKLFEISLLTNLLTNLPTEKYTASDLQKEITKTIGSISFDILSVDETKDCCKAYLVVNLGVLNEKTADAINLTSEILLHTAFDDSDRIYELLRQFYNMLEQALSANGHSFASVRALSGCSASASLKELTSGYTGMMKLKALLDNFNDDYNSLRDDFNTVMQNVFTQNDFVASLCGIDCKQLLNSFVSSFPTGDDKAQTLTFHLEKSSKEGITIPGDVSFASLAGHLHKEADAVALLSAHIFSYEYLWNEIRVQNGAYGAGLNVKENGEIAFYSYRDPMPDNSLEVYKKAGEWLRMLADEKPDLDAEIISTINELDPLQTSFEKLTTVSDGYFTGRGYPYRAKLRNALINVTADDLLSFADILDKLASDSKICVVGNSETLHAMPIDVLGD